MDSRSYPQYGGVLGIAQSLDKAYKQGWPMSKVEGELKVLIEIAEYAERLAEIEERLEVQEPNLALLKAWSDAMDKLRTTLKGK